MQAMICEMCNSNDLVKQDGMFVCQHCGTKYSVEEAKKLMGTVKVDKTEETEKLLVLARRAKDNKDSENAAKYYEMVLLEKPSNWEASFYSVYFTALNCTVGNIKSAAYSVANCLDSVLHLVKENVPDEEQLTVVSEIVQRCISIRDALYEAAGKSLNRLCDGIPYDRFSSDYKRLCAQYEDEYTDRAKACMSILDKCAEQIESIFEGEKQIQAQAAVAWEAMSYGSKTIGINYEPLSIGDGIIVLNEKYLNKINKYDPDYVQKCYNIIREQQQKAASANTKKSGCYVATAVYGSYDCPEVWTLRRYRDNTLASTYYGRAFIHTYYAISPTLVKWFGSSDWFKNMWKPKLDKMVDKLREQGVEDTPYDDNKW